MEYFSINYDDSENLGSTRMENFPARQIKTDPPLGVMQTNRTAGPIDPVRPAKSSLERQSLGPDSLYFIFLFLNARWWHQ